MLERPFERIFLKQIGILNHVKSSSSCSLTDLFKGLFRRRSFWGKAVAGLGLKLEVRRKLSV